jgi:hypothetical protein
MKSASKFAMGAAVTIVFFGGIAGYLLWIAPAKLVAEKCQGLEPRWSDFIDCDGAISVTDNWDTDYLSVKDHVHNYEIARVHNKNQYIIGRD